jgi:NAD(P)-dependent dehydrogenase (short-subunit alcohol dehydrogenase family)
VPIGCPALALRGEDCALVGKMRGVRGIWSDLASDVSFAIVTGGYSGIGLADTHALSAAGASVVVPARRPDVVREQLDGLDRVEVDSLDLADLGSVRSFAERFLVSGRSIGILLNNAAVMANPLTRVGPGWQSQFATNHLGHFA